MPEKSVTREVKLITEIPSGAWYFDGQENFSFDGQQALVSSIQFQKVEEKGIGGCYCNWGNRKINAQTVEGREVCEGITFDYRIPCMQKLTNPSFSYLDSWTFVPGSITISIKWSVYQPAPPQTITNNTVSNNEISPTPPNDIPDVTSTTETITITKLKTSEEWETQEVVFREGINVKCIDKYHKDTLKNGEIRASENIINGFIAEEAQAQRVGEYAINQTAKTRILELSIPPNFNIEPGKFIKTTCNSLNVSKIGIVQAVRFSINRNRSEYTIKVRTKEE